jgi:hypothetical protein
MPIWGSGRHVRPSDVAVLMAGAAFHAINPVSVGTAANSHGVAMRVIALSGEVPMGVAVHATGVAQNGNNRLKS